MYGSLVISCTKWQSLASIPLYIYIYITALASATGFFFFFHQKLASTVIQNWYDLAKMAMFRCLKNHVRIEIKTWNFANLLEVGQTNSKKNLKVNKYREGGFLEPPFSNKLSCDICIYRGIDAKLCKTLPFCATYNERTIHIWA